MISRRGFFGFLAAPAIVRVSALMPLSVLDPSLLQLPPTWHYQNLSFWVAANGKFERVVPPETLDHALPRLAVHR